MGKIRPFFASLALAALILNGCATVPDAPAPKHPEANSFDPSIKATPAVDGALAKAQANGHLVLLVLGANWCHDSRALAGWLATPRFQQLIADRFELVFVNIGLPQTGDGHNLHIPARFGIETIAGTPTVLILTGDGQPLNGDTASHWRNSASRTEDEIHAELASFAASRPFTAD